MLDYVFVAITTVLDVLSDPWVIFGLTVQAAFGMRFIIQWIASERAGRSTIPVAFWYFSIIGGLGLLIYSIQAADPVFIAGQSANLLIYFRNLWLIYKERRLSAFDETPVATPRSTDADTDADTPQSK